MRGLSRKVTLAFAIAVAISAAIVARANDTLATLGAGGLVPMKSTEIVMESENLQISVHQINIKYAFRNNSGHDVETIVAFPLPEISGADLYNSPISLSSKNALNFLNFTVGAGGKSIPTSTEIRAFDENGRDVTERLRSAGLSPTVMLGPLNCAVIKLQPDQRIQLEKAGLPVSGEFNPPISCSGKHGWWANWSLKLQFYWTQRFPANSTIEIEQSYFPIVGGSYIAKSDDGSALIRPYCGDGNTLNQIAALKAGGLSVKERQAAAALRERRIDYILTTANNWAGPVRKFHLLVTTDEPEDIVLTCMSGLKPTSPTQYELDRTDFRPNHDLKLLLLQPDKP